jgi:deazaflavin-dependent oxidoreductase (nitroreductase family)
MTPQEEVFDNPQGWVARHIRSYVETDGRQGHRWNGVHTLLLTTRGRKSGRLRRTALIYGRDDGRYLVVASQGGAEKHPSWYLNLTENPEVEVQVGVDKFTARAITATRKEKPRLWRSMTSIWPEYDRYQARTKREIPVVVLERRSSPRQRPGSGTLQRRRGR